MAEGTSETMRTPETVAGPVGEDAPIAATVPGVAPMNDDDSSRSSGAQPVCAALVPRPIR